MVQPFRTLNAVAVVCLLAGAIALSACTGEAQTLILATTTSTADSGLLEDILPLFEDETGAKVRVLAVGTGQALEIGERGDADVILVHDPARERQFVAEGHGGSRVDVMYNDFVILGPSRDPASIAGSSGAAVALARIAEAGRAGLAGFASRGDKSGTHSKELSIWSEADIAPDGGWYRSTGQGMGDTLTVANELLAYTLSDRGTFLSRADRLDLVVLVQGDELLFNPYGVMDVDPEEHSGVNHKLALRFIEFLTREDTQKRIGRFGIEQFGQPLFYPNSIEWKTEHPEGQ